MSASNSSGISVKVTKYADRRFWVMYYDDPITGRRIPRSTKETEQKAAEKVASKWEAELEKGQYKPKVKIEWTDFREQFLSHLDGSPDSTYAAYVTAFNAFERHVNIKRLAEATTPRIAYAAEQWRKEESPKSPETIASYLRHLKAALNWAVRMELLNEAPKITMPKRAKGQKRMKGRPITVEEFERMLAKVEEGLILASTSRDGANERKRQPSQTAVNNRMARLAEGAKAAAPSWRRFLRGLWWSGLRLGEAVSLSWDDDRCITVDTSGPRPRLRIEVGQDKSQEARLLPLAPEFAEMLLTVTAAKRSGPVFPLRGLQGEHVSDLIYVSRVVCKIGEAANVKVDERMKGSRRVVKYASAHDLRRAFGVRWSTRVMPKVLQELMRHADIGTTMKYYADGDVAAMEDAVYAALPVTKAKQGGKTTVECQ
jgi:integrase